MARTTIRITTRNYIRAQSASLENATASVGAYLNQAPQWSAVSLAAFDQGAGQQTRYITSTMVSDPNPGETVTITYIGGTLPTGVTFVSGPPGSSGSAARFIYNGTSPVGAISTAQLRATDNGIPFLTSDSATFSIQVVSQNRAPEWSGSAISVTQGNAVSLLSICSDPDGNQLLFTADTAAMSARGLSISGTSLVASSGAVVGAGALTITASDGSLTAQQSVTVTINQAQSSGASLTVQYNYNVVIDSVHSPDGYRWTKNWVTKDYAILGWADGNHGEPTGESRSTQDASGSGAISTANSVRLFNPSAATKLGIPSGGTGYVVRPRDTFRSGRTIGIDSNSEISSSPIRPATTTFTQPAGYQHGGYRVREVPDGDIIFWDATGPSDAGRIEIERIPAGTPVQSSGYFGLYGTYPAIYTCTRGLWIEGTGTVGGIGLYRPYSKAGSTAPLYSGGAPQPEYALASEYDNKQSFYVASDDKLFWIYYTQSPATVAGGVDDGGVFDVATGQWVYGNQTVARNYWTSGTYWTNYVKPFSTTYFGDIGSNLPTGYSEMLDMAVSLHRGESLFTIERNQSYGISGGETAPWRINLKGYPFSTNPWMTQQSTTTQGHMNSSVVVGEWWYFIRPLAFVSTSPVAEFWRVRLIPYWHSNNTITQYERLADLQGLYANAGTGLQSDIQLLVYDPPSKKIISVFETVQAYDIDANVWEDITPVGWRRHIGSVGGWKPNNSDSSVREVWFKGIVRDDQTNGAGKWSNLILTGAENRLKYTPTQLDQFYPDSQYSSSLAPSGANVLGGKHRRFIPAPASGFRDVNNSLVRPTGSQGNYIFVIGGDFAGVPQSNFLPTARYPDQPGKWGGADDSSRADQWRLAVKEDANGKLIVDMLSNAWYQYGNPSATVKPPATDAVGVVFDKRGDMWVGPGYWRFGGIHEQPEQPMGVMRFRMPGKHTDGIRKGDGWYLPPQNYLVANSSTYDAVTNIGGKINADDIVIGNDPGNGLIGSAHMYTTYDPKTDMIMFMSAGDRFNRALYTFPCVPTAGRQVWTRQTISLSLTERNRLYAFLNTQIRAGATAFSESNPPGPFKVGAQHAINDDLFVLCVTNAGSGYNTRSVVWITRWNLRNPSDPPEYIALPSFFCRGIDKELGPSDTVSDALCQSPAEFRDLLRMGHILAFGPPSDNVVDSDPLYYWYDTYRKSWTIGPTYTQIKASIPSIPDQPGRFGGFATQRFAGAKGRSFAVPETGEIWFACSDWGVIRYRII